MCILIGNLKKMYLGGGSSTSLQWLVNKPDDSDDKTVCPEVEGEIEEDDLDAATVEHLDVDRHEEAKDWIESQDGNDDQAV